MPTVTLDEFWKGFLCGAMILAVLLTYQFFNRDAQFYRGYQAATLKLIGIETELEIISSKRELMKIVEKQLNEKFKAYERKHKE